MKIKRIIFLFCFSAWLAFNVFYSYNLLQAISFSFSLGKIYNAVICILCLSATLSFNMLLLKKAFEGKQ